MLRNIFRYIHMSWRQFTFSLQPNNVFLQFWQMFVSKRIWWTMPGLQLTLFAVEARGNFKGRFSCTHIYMEKVYVLFLLFFVIIRDTNLNITIGLTVQICILFLFGKKKTFFFLPGIHNLYFIFPLSTWDYRKCFILLFKANVYTFWVEQILSRLLFNMSNFKSLWHVPQAVHTVS